MEGEASSTRLQRASVMRDALCGGRAKVRDAEARHALALFEGLEEARAHLHADHAQHERRRAEAACGVAAHRRSARLRIREQASLRAAEMNASLGWQKLWGWIAERR